jgi:NADPH:quinone reductase-like Zn-dependent oxidoreductase
MKALQALNKGRSVAEGDHIFINGASSGVGVFAVQLAKSMGAHVTGVCSTKNFELVRSLGADVVIDCKKEGLETQKNIGKYDKIIDIVGRFGWFRPLNLGGEIISVALPKSECIPCILCRISFTSGCCYCLTSKRSHVFMQKVNVEDLKKLGNMLVSGNLRSIVSRHVGIESIPNLLAENIQTNEHTAGKVVVLFNEESDATALTETIVMDR